MLGLTKIAVWSAWLVVAALLFARPFRWQANYFLVHGNRLYYLAMWGMFGLLALVCLIYVPYRRRALWRWDLPLILVLGVVFVAAEQPLALLVTLLFFLACFNTGSRLARVFGIRWERPAEKLALGFSTGCAAYLPVLFTLGELHAYYWYVFWLLVLAPIAIWHRETAATAQAVGQLWRSVRLAEELRHPLAGVAVVFLAAAVFFSAAAALTPSITFDTLNMHLPAAQYYSALHTLQPVPMMPYSFYPQGFETLVLLVLQLGGQAAAQLVAPLFFAVFLLLLFEIGRACCLDLTGIFTGVTCVAMTPFILWDGTQTKNDIILAAFQLAALLCCLRWRETKSRGWLMLGAVFIASSICIKYTAVYGAIPLVILFLAQLWKYQGKRLILALAFLLLMGVLGSYWQARAFVYTGNPVYPETLERAAQPGGVRAGARWRGRVRRLGRKAWDLNFVGRPYFESPIRNPLGMFLLTFAPLAVLASWRRDANRRLCLFYIGLYVLYWLGTVGALRYALPAFALIILFLAAKAKAAYDEHWVNAARPVRFSIAGALAVSLAFGLLGVILVVSAPGEFAYLAHRIGKDAYLGNNLPEYNAMQEFRRLDPHAAMFVTDVCSRAYSPDPGAFACSAGENERIQGLLNRHTFEFIAIPADKEERTEILEGWKAEQVYRDSKFVGYRIAR